MITRRDWLKFTTLLGAGLALNPGRLLAEESLITRAIPSSGERLPIVGLGTSASFRRLAGGEDDVLRQVLATLFDNGGTVIDTAPSYAEAEAVAGEMVGALGAREKAFWATKLNARPRVADRADPAAARAQLERSFERIGKDPIDLIQVHNLADIPTQLGLLKEYQQDRRIRYIGTTSTRHSQYEELARVMASEPLDFIGIDYAVDNRRSAERILPLAADRGIGVLVYVPFGRTRLWSRVEGVDLPAWAGELGIRSWAQFFIKFAAAHPAVTVVTPATSKPKHMLDNLGAAHGELPDRAMQERMVAFVDGLPEA